MKAEYPEIVNSARLCNGPHALNFSYGDKRFREEVEAGDPSFLEMFSFPPDHGRFNQSTFNKYDFQVTGVLAELLHNSILQFDFLVPIEFLTELWHFPKLLTRWSDFSFTTYTPLQNNASFKEVSRKIAGRIQEGDEGFEGDAFLWSFTKLYLHGLGTGRRRMAIMRMLFLIAVFILLIACINFMNLTFFDLDYYRPK